MKIGLVLEGGGMRGLYTMGVLDAFMEYNIWADYVIGVSAGACSGTSYLSKQQYRNYNMNVQYAKDKRYVSIQNFIKTKSVFGMDFIFDEIPLKLMPFDYDTFLQNPTEFRVGVTDMQTGKPVYFDKQPTVEQELNVVRASSSIPMFAPPVKIDDKLYLDGGTSDPIPFKQALLDGCKKLFIVRTRDRNYHKTPENGQPIYNHTFRDVPGMIDCIDHRHEVYNHQVWCTERMEKAGQAMIFAPEQPVELSRFENDIRKLDVLYREGWQSVETRLDEIKAFMKK